MYEFCMNAFWLFVASICIAMTAGVWFLLYVAVSILIGSSKNESEKTK